MLTVAGLLLVALGRIALVVTGRLAVGLALLAVPLLAVPLLLVALLVVTLLAALALLRPVLIGRCRAAWLAPVRVVLRPAGVVVLAHLSYSCTSVALSAVGVRVDQ